MSLATAVRRLARALAAANRKVVFAESCTGGLASAALTRVPGISSYHCGGVVVYRNETKQAYLNVPSRLLKTAGPVSAAMTRFLAKQVLAITPQADLAVAITGHLGPGAPPHLDGHVYVAIAARNTSRKQIGQPRVWSLRCRPNDSRSARQRWAAESALELAAQSLEQLVQ